MGEVSPPPPFLYNLYFGKGSQSLEAHGDRLLAPGAPLTYFNDGGVRRIFLGLTFWPEGIFWVLWKMLGFFWVAKTTQGFFWVLYFLSAQIKNNISAIYSFVFDQNQSWSWHVLAFQKINNKICWCKNTEGFFWVDKFWSWDFFGYKIWTSVGSHPPSLKYVSGAPGLLASLETPMSALAEQRESR